MTRLLAQEIKTDTYQNILKNNHFAKAGDYIKNFLYWTIDTFFIYLFVVFQLFWIENQLFIHISLEACSWSATQLNMAFNLDHMTQLSDAKSFNCD